jgi:tRNA(fMet)-specific endonuclease VapC
MVVLDTAHLSILEWPDTPKARRLRERLRAINGESAVATIVSFEEQMRGWMAILAGAKTLARQIIAYQRLQRQLRNYCDIDLRAFDEQAATEFQRLRKLGLRLGTMDLKIAAIALANDATLLSRNVRDFSQIPGLKLGDWTE